MDDAQEYARSGGPGGPDRRPPRSWWLAAVSAVIVVVALVAGVAGLGSSDEEGVDDAAASGSASATASPSDDAAGTTTPSSGSSPTTAGTASSGPSSEAGDAPRGEPTGDPGVTEAGALQLPAQQGRCMVPTAQSLKRFPMAFLATVTSVDDEAGTVLLSVDRWFTAEGFGGTDTIMVTEPPALRETMLEFREGRDYLVAAGQDATVALCGFSGPRTRDLLDLYEQAFA